MQSYYFFSTNQSNGMKKKVKREWKGEIGSGIGCILRGINSILTSFATTFMQFDTKTGAFRHF